MMVATDDKPDFVPLEKIPEDRMGDPQAYLDANCELLGRMFEGAMSPLDGDRFMGVIEKACYKHTGLHMEDISRERLNPVDKLRTVFGATETELESLEDSFKHINATRAEKKKWKSIIRRVIVLQREARDDPAKFWVYVGRNQEDASILRMEWFHLRYFEVWNDPDYQHSIIEAPPGHGKTMCLRGQICWEVGMNPHLRCLIVYAQKSQVAKEVMTLKATFRSERFHAIFPDVTVLSRQHGEEDSSKRFTVSRKNWMSREPTIEGAAIGSNVNGDGYDRLYGDDVSPPTVAEHPVERRQVIDTWNAVLEARLRNPAEARIRFVCTPWHDEDLAASIVRNIESGARRNWQIAIDDFRVRKIGPDDYEPLWPEKFGKKFLRQQARILGPIKFARNYELIARKDEERVLNQVHFYPSVSNDATAPKHKAVMAAVAAGEHWLSIDPSATANRWSSATGVVKFSITPGGFVFIPDCWFLRKNPSEMLEWIIDQIIHAPDPGYAGLMVEAQGPIKGMVNMWVDAMQPDKLRALGYDRPLAILTPGTRLGQTQNRGKLSRHRDASPYFSNGIVRFAGQMEWEPRLKGGKGDYLPKAISGGKIQKLTQMMMDFDGTNLSDAVDAANQFVLYFRARIRDWKTPAETAAVEAPKVGTFQQLLAEQIESITKQAEAPESAYSDEEDFCTAVLGAA